MESLRQQINPSLLRTPEADARFGIPATNDPDMTFRQYVESLIGQPITGNKGFSSAFVGSGANAGAQQPSTPTQSITEGMFSKYLNDGGGYGGDSDNSISSGTPSSISSQSIADLGHGIASMTPGQVAGVVSGLMSGNIGAALTAATGHSFIDDVAIPYMIGKIANTFGTTQDPTNVSVVDAAPIGVSGGMMDVTVSPVSDYGTVVGTPLGPVGGGGGDFGDIGGSVAGSSADSDVSASEASGVGA